MSTDAAAPALASVETIKARSRRLRGTLAEGLQDPITGALHEDDTQLLKYHGSYQQDDRDLREERRLQKLEPAYAFMIRARLPGGVVTPAQWLRLDAIARTYAERGIRLTTRQTVQLHGVLKRDLKRTLQDINAALIDTIATCGDINRNVTVGANPQRSALHAALYAQAAALSEHLLPRTRAYHEIWLDEKRVAGSGEEEEPLYGPAYLPRKFKIGFAIPPDNDVDVLSQDLGFVAHVETDAVAGYTVTVGGGMGATAGDARTYPRIADALGFVRRDQVLAVATAVITAQRDLGDRGDRRQARLKYTLDRLGLDRLRAEVERRAGFELQPPRPFAFTSSGDRFGWTQGDDGLWHLTLRIVAGRLQDSAERSHLSGLREIAAIHPGVFRITPNQNLVIAGVPGQACAAVDALVARHQLGDFRHASPLQLHALACVALPTCGLAMAEAERYLPDLLRQVQALLHAHGLGDAPLGLRISGCPNGCSRPYLSEVALVGRAPGRYDLRLGGDHRGQRLNVLYRENLDEAAVLAALDPLLQRYAAERAAGERFGDFLVRAGVVVPAVQRT